MVVEANSSDKRIANTICLIVIGVFLTSLSSGISTLVGVDQGMVASVCKIGILAALVWCIPAFYKRFSHKIVWYVLGICLVVLLQLFFFQKNNWYFRSTLEMYATQIFPAAICMMALSDYDILLKRLIVASYGISFVALAVFLFASNEAFSEGYSMGFASSMLLPTNVLLMNAMVFAEKHREKWFSLFLVVTNVVSICVYGSRGALVSIVVFFAYLLFRGKPNAGNPLPRILAIAVFVVLIIFYEPILQSLNEALQGAGFNSRTLNLLINNLEYDSGRSEIWSAVWNDFAASPFTVRGINSDYMLTGQYAHNIVLELLHEFGVVIGTIVIIFILSRIVKTFSSGWTNRSIVITVLFFCIFPLCLWSGSIWRFKEFWMWIMVAGGKNMRMVTGEN